MNCLLIEDDLKLGRLLKLMLESRHHIVTWLTNEHEGLDYAMTVPFDILLIDWMLPEMSGTEIISAIRSHQLNTPIIMLTAKGTVEDKVTSLSTGADDYLVKPFDFEELHIRMLALARRAAGRQKTSLNYGLLSLDPLTMSVHLNHEILNLTHKEYQLIELLLQHQDHNVTKEMIIDRLWTIDDIVSDNTVEALIKRVRRKLQPAMQIKTTRNLGYRLNYEN